MREDDRFPRGVRRRRNPVLEKFINHLIKDGLRVRAWDILNQALEEACRKIRAVDPERILEVAVSNTTPLIWARRALVGGRVYLLPEPVAPRRKVALAIRAIIDAARSGRGLSFKRRLARALIAAYGGKLPRPAPPGFAVEEVSIDRGPDRRTPRAARLSARRAYGSPA